MQPDIEHGQHGAYNWPDRTLSANNGQNYENWKDKRDNVALMYIDLTSDAIADHDRDGN